MARKGIILAGGSGTRLYPLTISVSKQLMPVYDKPMIYYPLSVLMEAQIREVLIITTPNDAPLFKKLLGDGTDFGMKFEYEVQQEPKGLAEAFIIGKDFIGNDDVAMILGDNMFYGQNLKELLQRANKRSNATIFGYEVNQPQAYGVVEFDKDGNVLSIEEKPEKPLSNYAVPGIYFYPNDVVKVAQNVKPSKRGELEITSINEYYLTQNKLHCETFGRGMTWFDTGTHEALLQTASFVETIEKRQGMQVCCPEEIAFENNWIDKDKLLELSKKYIKTDYGKYLEKLANKS